MTPAPCSRAALLGLPRSSAFSFALVALACALAACRAAPGPAPPAARVSALRPGDLRAEGLVAPLGLGTRRPRFSWTLSSPRRGELQTAYRVLAASQPELLARDQGDLWDSGWVSAAAQNQVVYGGAPLSSRQRVHWKVQVRDAAGLPSTFSEPATFEMGLLDPADWQGRWIASAAGDDDAGDPPRLDLGAARWIWFPDEPAASSQGGEPPGAMPVGRRRLRKVFDLPRGAQVRAARLVAGANDHATVLLNGRPVLRVSLGKASEEVEVRDALVPGRNVLAAVVENTGGRAAFLARLAIELAQGPPVQVVTDGSFRAERVDPRDPAPEAAGAWTRAGFSDRAWAAARVLGEPEDPRYQAALMVVGPARAPRAPCFRKAFTLDGEVVSARAYVAGVGYHLLEVNGQPIGDQVLAPSFTDYGQRVEVVAHDVTAALQAGENVVGVVLGHGLFRQHDSDAWDFHRAPWRQTPRLLAQLHVRLRDGRERVIASDGSWLQGSGPIVYDGTRHGETWDAREERPGWSRPGPAPEGFVPAREVTGPAGRLVAQEHPPIRVTETRRPAAVRAVAPGQFVLDAGQNLAGWVRLRVRGPRGTRVTLRYGEKLHPDGTLDTANIDGLVRTRRFQTDEYVLAGRDAVEVWEPHFAYHGFQYVEITGWPGTPTVDDLDVRVVHTDFAPTGELEVAHPLLTRLHAATRWSFRSNFHGIPTDCPHREKNGWTGDAHLAVMVGLYNFDVAPAYRKWIADLLDAQQPEGDLPGIVPTGGWGRDRWSGPSWEAALFELPWALYLHEGDTRTLETVLPAWERYLAHAERRAASGLADHGLGDWVPWKTRTPVAVTSTASLHRMMRLGARAARLLGHAELAARFARFADLLRSAFARAFVDGETGRVAGDEPTALGMALSHGLVEGELAARVAARLAARVRADGHHLDTGVLGAKFVPRALWQAGLREDVFRVFTRDTPPSWGHWIRQGATTLWENWDGSASRNHVFFGDLDAWLYDGLLGIEADPEAPGFAHVLFRPYLPPADAGVPAARARFRSIRGPIESAWRRTPDGVEYVFEVPAGSRATAEIPAADPSRVRESGRALADLPEVSASAGPRPGLITLRFGSGRYLFLAPAP